MAAARTPRHVEASPLRDRVLFVEGVPRSGTTLLISLLAAHPQIAAIAGESHLFDDRGLGTVFENHAGTERFRTALISYLDEAELVGAVREFSDRVLCTMRSKVKPDAPWVAEKTPVPFRDPDVALARKLAVYPDAHYLHVVRDEEAVARSLVRAEWAQCDESGARRWHRRGVAAIREACAGHRYDELNYDDLAADPIGAVERALEPIGLTVDDATRARIDAISRERISSFDFREAPAPRPGRTGAALRALRAGVREGVQRVRGRREALAGELLGAIREADLAAIERLTDARIEVVLRSADGDAVARGGEGRAMLAAAGRRIFGDHATIETGAVVGRSPGLVVLIGLVRGDGSRLDATLILDARRGRVLRATILIASGLAGRPARVLPLSEIEG